MFGWEYSLSRQRELDLVTVVYIRLNFNSPVGKNEFVISFELYMTLYSASKRRAFIHIGSIHANRIWIEKFTAHETHVESHSVVS